MSQPPPGLWSWNCFDCLGARLPPCIPAQAPVTTPIATDVLLTALQALRIIVSFTTWYLLFLPLIHLPQNLIKTLLFVATGSKSQVSSTCPQNLLEVSMQGQEDVEEQQKDMELGGAEAHLRGEEGTVDADRIVMQIPFGAPKESA